MQRRTFLTISGTAAGCALLKPSMTVFTRTRARTENQNADVLTNLVNAATSQGAQYADARMVLHRGQTIQLRKDLVHSISDNEEMGFVLRVYKNGGWASTACSARDDVRPARMAKEALASAALVAAIVNVPFLEAGRISDLTSEYATPIQRDPFTLSIEEKVDFLREIATYPLSVQQLPYAIANLFQNRTETSFVNSRNVQLRQTFTSVYQNYAVTAFSPQKRRMDSRSSPREARAGGWEIAQEYVKSEMETLMQEALKKLNAEALPSGKLDLVIDATVMWDLIVDTLLPHLDARRLLQRDGVRPGGRWISGEMVGTARIASKALTLGWDNTLAGGLATCGWDDSGRPADKGTLIENGVLKRIVGSDEIDSLPAHVPFTRGHSWRTPAQCSMPNITVKAGAGKSLQQLIDSVDDGLLIKGRGSIVTNPQRTMLRLRPQIGIRIRKGALSEMVRDFEVELPTDQFWNKLEEVGGAQGAMLAGEMFPDRAYPLWSQPFSVSTPPALFRGVPVFSSQENA